MVMSIQQLLTMMNEKPEYLAQIAASNGLEPPPTPAQAMEKLKDPSLTPQQREELLMITGQQAQPGPVTDLPNVLRGAINSHFGDPPMSKSPNALHDALVGPQAAPAPAPAPAPVNPAAAAFGHPGTGGGYREDKQGTPRPTAPVTTPAREEPPYRPNASQLFPVTPAPQAAPQIVPSPALQPLRDGGTIAPLPTPVPAAAPPSIPNPAAAAGTAAPAAPAVPGAIDGAALASALQGVSGAVSTGPGSGVRNPQAPQVYNPGALQPQMVALLQNLVQAQQGTQQPSSLARILGGAV